MNQASLKMRRLAKLLMACETAGNKSTSTTTLPAFRVCEKLRPQLANLTGKAGFHALLVRALALASAEVPQLRAVTIKADGSLEELGGPGDQAPSKKNADRSVVLPAQLLDLLGAFIGEHLTLSLVRETWPNLAAVDLDFNQGNQNEKSK